MPYSAPTFDPELELYFRQVRHGSVMDIGPGEGKYGQMLRRVQPTAKRIAVELESEYVEKFKLGDLYDEVRIHDAAALLEDVDQVFDAVIVGDSIEHMRKSVGLDLLNFLVYRSRIIMVKFPLQMLQNSWQGHKSEAHVSVWSERDFGGMDYVFAERDFVCLALVRGYLNQSMEWVPGAVMQRLGHPGMAEFYAQDPLRLSLADMETRRQDASLAEINSIIPAGATYILVDEMLTRLAQDPGHKTLPFLENNGQYWGPPADDEQAVAGLERLRQGGCSHVVFAWPSHWWLDHYREFAEHLRGRYPCALENGRLVIFDLRITVNGSV
jgi:hypothetical protein